jgi:hypothetical protein
MGHAISKHETFFSSQPREIHILSAHEANELLLRADLIDNYRRQCSQCSVNNKARQGQDYSGRPASANAIDFQRAINTFPDWLKNYLPPILYIAFLAPSADGGMPHTRPSNIICLPQFFDINDPNAIETFMHECIHIHQRTYTELWNRLYYEVFSMEPYNGTLPDTLETKRRLNPDTILEPLYMWKKRWASVPVYLRVDSPQLGQIRIAYYNVKSGAWQSFIPSEMEEFSSLSVSQAEHPAELAAYWLSSSAGDGHPLKRVLQNRIEELSNDEYN